LLLGQSFTQSGWALRPGEIQDVDSLPAYVYADDGESVLQPIAEVWLNERSAGVIADQGIMPVVSIQGSDSVRLASFHSLAKRAMPLAGPWEK
jgi:type VI secretion system protein ImpC